MTSLYTVYITNITYFIKQLKEISMFYRFFYVKKYIFNINFLGNDLLTELNII